MKQIQALLYKLLQGSNHNLICFCDVFDELLNRINAYGYK